MKAHLVGKRLGECLKEITDSGLSPNLWRGKKGYNKDEGYSLFLAFPNTVVSADGERVLIHNPQNGSLRQRAEHLMMFSGHTNAMHPIKSRWLPNIVTTLENAAFRLYDQEDGTWLYGMRYNTRDIHLVVVRPKKNPTGPTAISGYLITQFVLDFPSRQSKMSIAWIAPEKNPVVVTPLGKMAPDGEPPGERLSESV